MQKMISKPIFKGFGSLLVASFLLVSACKQPSVDPVPGGSVLPTRDSNLALGNPTQASSNSADNYLMDKGTFVLSYNASAAFPTG